MTKGRPAPIRLSTIRARGYERARGFSPDRLGPERLAEAMSFEEARGKKRYEFECRDGWKRVCYVNEDGDVECYNVPC